MTFSTIIQQVTKPSKNSSNLYVINNLTDLDSIPLSADIVKQAKKVLKDQNFFKLIFAESICVISKITENDFKAAELARKNGALTTKLCNEKKVDSLTVYGTNAQNVLQTVEGAALANYQFTKYFVNGKQKINTLKTIAVQSKEVNTKQITEIQELVNAVYLSRNLVNEPQRFLTATQLSEEIKNAAKNAGFKAEVFNKKKIETLKMGGILAVNQGSVEPPTFNILEYKPKNAVNKNPIVLVGKGVVYDTGGLSLKPTTSSMDYMKSDMAGAAAVVGTLYAVAKNKLPVYVVGLIPATDNMPSATAVTPGDVITMYNGSTVEVLNTDAEGRLILADALTYAKKYNPLITIDLATLTGAAARTVAHHAIVSMGNTQTEMEKLKTVGFNVYERLAELPLWDEYGEMLKSDIADLKNIGGMLAGSITAGKFLEHFVNNQSGKADYPWIHLDIAGPAFLDADSAYRTKNGSGVGVRLLYEYIKNITS